MAKIMEKFVQDVQKALNELEDTNKLLRFLSGEYTPKLDRKYVVYLKKSGEHYKALASASYFADLPMNIYVSKDAPIVIYSDVSKDVKTFKLIPAESEYLVIKPCNGYKFRIIGKEEYGTVFIKLSDNFSFEEVIFDLEAIKHFIDLVPNQVFDVLSRVLKKKISERLSGADADCKDILDEIVSYFDKYFLSVSFTAKNFVNALLFEDISILREPLCLETKRLVLRRLNERFEKILETTKKVAFFPQ